MRVALLSPLFFVDDATVRERCACKRAPYAKKMMCRMRTLCRRLRPLEPQDDAESPPPPALRDKDIEPCSRCRAVPDADARCAFDMRSFVCSRALSRRYDAMPRFSRDEQEMFVARDYREFCFIRRVYAQDAILISRCAMRFIGSHYRARFAILRGAFDVCEMPRSQRLTRMSRGDGISARMMPDAPMAADAPADVTHLPSEFLSYAISDLPTSTLFSGLGGAGGGVGAGWPVTVLFF